MKQIPDEPSIARTLRTGYPQRTWDWNREDIWELHDDEYMYLVNERRTEKRYTLRCTE